MIETTDAELLELCAVTHHYCLCPPPRPRGWRQPPCPACDLLGDITVIRRLVFYRRYADALRRSEALEPSGWREVLPRVTDDVMVL